MGTDPWTNAKSAGRRLGAGGVSLSPGDGTDPCMRAGVCTAYWPRSRARTTTISFHRPIMTEEVRKDNKVDGGVRAGFHARPGLQPGLEPV
jgi:hypothetical protein